MKGSSVQIFAEEYLERLGRLVDELPVERIEMIGDLLFDAYLEGRQVFVAGNGGSAATASHLACDLGKSTNGVARLRTTCLNDNVPTLTALANDAGYERVFSEQLVGVIQAGEILIVLSGSGRSPNILEAMRYARSRSATVVALLGFDGGEAIELADHHVLVTSDEYPLVEDVHMILDHLLTGCLKQRVDHAELAPR